MTATGCSRGEEPSFVVFCDAEPRNSFVNTELRITSVHFASMRCDWLFSGRSVLLTDPCPKVQKWLESHTTYLLLYKFRHDIIFNRALFLQPILILTIVTLTPLFIRVNSQCVTNSWNHSHSVHISEPRSPDLLSSVTDPSVGIFLQSSNLTRWILTSSALCVQ